MPSCDFTYSHYENILDLIKKSDYTTAFFNEAHRSDRELILRHDIDVDLKKAYGMARIEKKYGIKTTYFILIRSPFYNIFDRSNSDFIRGISDLGHQIGLHFDETYYGMEDAESINRNVDTEVQILKDYFNISVIAVSFHRPSKFIIQSDIKLNNNLVNTYARNFTEGFKYVSDSRRMWKEGCFCRFFEKASPEYHKHDRIQTLVHPVWWTDKSLDTQETVERFFIEKIKQFDIELGKNIQVYKQLL